MRYSARFFAPGAAVGDDPLKLLDDLAIPTVLLAFGVSLSAGTGIDSPRRWLC